MKYLKGFIYSLFFLYYCWWCCCCCYIHTRIHDFFLNRLCRKLEGKYTEHFDCRILAIIEKSKTVLVASENLVYHFSHRFFQPPVLPLSCSLSFLLISLHGTVFLIFSFEHIESQKRYKQVIGSLRSYCRHVCCAHRCLDEQFLCAFLPIFIEHLKWMPHRINLASNIVYQR